MDFDRDAIVQEWMKIYRKPNAQVYFRRQRNRFRERVAKIDAIPDATTDRLSLRTTAKKYFPANLGNYSPICSIYKCRWKKKTSIKIHHKFQLQKHN